MSDVSVLVGLKEAVETAMRGFERIKTSDLTMDGFTTFHGRLSMDEVVAFNDLFAGVFRVASWFVECDNCPGDGVAYVTFEEPCPSCRARGVRFTDETIERAAKAYFDASHGWPDDDWATFPKALKADRRRFATAALWSLFTTKEDE